MRPARADSSWVRRRARLARIGSKRREKGGFNIRFFFAYGKILHGCGRFVKSGKFTGGLAFSSYGFVDSNMAIIPFSRSLGSAQHGASLGPCPFVRLGARGPRKDD